MNVRTNVERWRLALVNASKRTRIFLGSVGIVVLAYAIAMAAVGHAAYANTAPSKTIRTLVHLFPLPAVRVDGSFIWMGQYVDRYSYIDSYVQKTATPNFTPQQTRDQVIDYLTETNIIGQLAHTQHVTVSSKDIDAAYQQIVNAPGVNGEAEVQKVLKELYGMSQQEFKSLIGEQLLRERVEQNVFLHVVSRQILVATEAQANDLVNQIKNGAKFEDLAKQYSEDTNSRDKGGDLGPVGRGSGLPKEVEDAIFSTDPNALPIVVKSDLGYHIIDTEERKGVIDANFSDWLAQQKHDRSITVFVHTTLDWINKKK